MDWREALATDLPDCFKVEPRIIGDEIVGHECALRIWRDWTQSFSFNSALVEAATAPRQVIAFGASLFVAPDFATHELERPQPGLNSRILASVASGRSVVLPKTQLSGSDASDGLDLVALTGTCLYEAMNPQQTTQAEMAMAISFAKLHVGYRLNRIFIETRNSRHRKYLESSGVWRVVAEFPRSGSAFLVLTAKEAFSVSGSVAALLFQYREPVLHLRNSEKELLSKSMNGETDNELAARLNLSLPAIKKRWVSVFDRIAEVRPDLLPDAERRGLQESRGPQKRHRILAYLRSHPEELRPYRWRSTVHS